jgi:hypothetical protein
MAIKTTLKENDPIYSTDEFNGLEIRYVQIGKVEYFVAKEICLAIGYKNAHQTLKKLESAAAELQPRFMAMPTKRSGYQKTALITLQAVDYLADNMNHPAAQRIPGFLRQSIWENMVMCVYTAIERAGYAGLTFYDMTVKRPYFGMQNTELSYALETLLTSGEIELTATKKYRASDIEEETQALPAPVFVPQLPEDLMANLNSGPIAVAAVADADDGDGELDLSLA